MTRAAERPPVTDHMPEEHWEEHTQGDSPDTATRQALHLAHRVADKFPELTDRYRRFAGPAAIVSGALVVLAGVAVSRRLRRGQRPEEILDQITSDEIESAATVTQRHNRWWRLIVRVARRRRNSEKAASAGS